MLVSSPLRARVRSMELSCSLKGASESSSSHDDVDDEEEDDEDEECEGEVLRSLATPRAGSIVVATPERTRLLSKRARRTR